MSYVKDTIEKLWRTLKAQKRRNILCAENTLRKLLCKSEDRVATEDKNNIVYKIGYSNKESTTVNLNG